MRKLILPLPLFLPYRCFLFLLGGSAYGCIEILWRGRTHPTMILLGGLCFLLFSEIRRLPFFLPLRCVLCALAVTAAEYLCGVVVNLWLGWGVWDYSKEAFSFQGQICFKYSLYWLALSIPAFLVCQGSDRLCLRLWHRYRDQHTEGPRQSPEQFTISKQI